MPNNSRTMGLVTAVCILVMSTAVWSESLTSLPITSNHFFAAVNVCVHEVLNPTVKRNITRVQCAFKCINNGTCHGFMYGIKEKVCRFMSDDGVVVCIGTYSQDKVYLRTGHCFKTVALDTPGNWCNCFNDSTYGRCSKTLGMVSDDPQTLPPTGGSPRV